MALFIAAFLSLLSSIFALHFSISPPENAFFLHSQSQPTNASFRTLFLQNDCPFSTDQRVSLGTGNRQESSRLFSAIPNLHCAVSVKIVNDVVKLDRPYIDVLAVADLSLLSFLKQAACVTVKVTSARGDSVSSTCHVSPFEDGRQTCLIRVVIPHGWFGAVGRTATRQTLTVSHTVSSTCNVPFYDRPQTQIAVMPFIESAQSHTLANHSNMDLSLLSRANISLSYKSLNSLFVHLSYNSTVSITALEIRLFIDSRLELVSVAPLSADDWSVRVASAQRPDVYTAFICTPSAKIQSFDGYIFSILVRLKGIPAENRQLEKGISGSDAVLHWEIHTRTDAINKTETIHRVSTKFGVTPDTVYAVVPVAKHTSLVNTGIVSGRQSSVSMRVFSVTFGGTARDVTAMSHCISAEAKVLKTSPTCTTVYVDGSEMRGHSNVEIHVSYETWTTSIAFTVWFPKLPVTVWMKDHQLNSISGWPVAKWKELSARHTRRSAKQFTCQPRFQQTEVRVLASFEVSDEKTGERLFLSGNRDLLFDVTALASDSIRSLDRTIATLRTVGDKVLLQATGVGITRVVVKRSGALAVELGGTQVSVSPSSVTVLHMKALPVVELNMNIEPVLGKRAQYTVAASIDGEFEHRYQHGTFVYQLVYSDETTEELSDVPTGDFNLQASSTDDKIVALSHKAHNVIDMIALDDATDPAVELEILAPTHCRDTDSQSVAATLVPIRLRFGENDSNRVALAVNVTPTTSEPQGGGIRLETIGSFLFIVVIVVGAVHLASKRTRMFSGYEKLVAPILSRLSSSSSGSAGRDEDTKEWVWLSRSRGDTNSIGSRYSRKSAAATSQDDDDHTPSYDDNTHTSISYRGSEISVFISPTPVVAVHADRSASWRGAGGSTRTAAATRHALVDSSSEHNLARVVARTGSWRDADAATWQQQHHTWNAKRRAVFDGIRESVA